MTPGLDQLTSVSEAGTGRSFGYDADGNMTARGADTLAWDGRGRHSGGVFGGTTVSYGFDPVGFRRSRTAEGETARFLHGGLFETTEAGAITLSEVEGPGGDLAHYQGPPTTASTVGFLYYDGHGNLAASADSAGARTASFVYDPFGEIRSGPAGSGVVERFTGRWDKKHDTASGLIEMGVRPYDPALGRFLAVDPIEGGSANNYDYADQDPINGYDLTGTASCNRWKPWCKEAYPTLFRIREAIGSFAERHPTLFTAITIAIGGRGGVRTTSPAAFTGFTRHGLNQVVGRDLGRGVAPRAYLDALRNPMAIKAQSKGRVLIRGRDATVVLNSQGKLVTAWANNRAGIRGPGAY